MRLIMENWRSYILLKEQETQGEMRTIGDLIAAINTAKRNKALAKGGKATAIIASGGILGGVGEFFDAAMAMGDALGLAKSLYGGDLSDKKQPAALKSISVDPDVSRIVDDDIEEAFLSHLSTELENMDPKTSIKTVNTTAMLQRFIADKFNDKTVK